MKMDDKVSESGPYQETRAFQETMERNDEATSSAAHRFANMAASNIVEYEHGSADIEDVFSGIVGKSGMCFSDLDGEILLQVYRAVAEDLALSFNVTEGELK